MRLDPSDSDNLILSVSGLLTEFHFWKKKTIIGDFAKCRSQLLTRVAATMFSLILERIYSVVSHSDVSDIADQQVERKRRNIGETFDSLLALQFLTL